MRGLPPAIHPMVRSFLADGDRPAALRARWGSPLNLVFPQIFRANLAAFRAILDRSGLDYRIHYVHKANQARAFVRAALDAGIGIDVASPGELASALAAGFPAGRIEATGPKGRPFLSQLVEKQVMVNVDNLWELAELIRLARQRRPARSCPGQALRLRSARRCWPAQPVRRARPRVTRRSSTCCGRARMRWTSWGCPSTWTPARPARRSRRPMTACAFRAGLRGWPGPARAGYRRRVPVGLRRGHGGVRRVRAGHEGRPDWPRAPADLDGNTLGYRFEDGRVQGVPVFHKYANRLAGPESLGQLLDGVPPGQGGRRTAQVLRENMIELWLEPGKSLADQAGVTLASVEFVKEAADGSLLVNLDLSRDKLCPAGQEVMLDPVLIYRSAPRSGLADPHAGPGQRAGVFLGGNLCLERDMIFNHLTFVERIPGPGNIVAFINTAAYQMDLSASGALMQHRAAKVTVDSSASGFTACADSGDQQEEARCFTPTSPS